MSQDLERFFDLSVDLMCLAGVDGYFKRVNPAFERVLGWTTEELLSTPFMDLVHPEDKDATAAEIAKLGSGGTTVSFKNRFRNVDGEYRSLEWSARPEEATDLLYAVARDVTELERAEERFRIAIESSPAPMLVANAQGTIELINGAGEGLLGYDAGELTGKSVDTLVPVSLRGQHGQHRLSYLDGPVARPMGMGRDLEAVRKDGSRVQVEIGLNPVYIRGKLAALIAFVDISARKELQAQLTQSRDDLLAVLNGLREGVLIVHRSGRITFVNNTVATLFGLDAEALEGLHWRKIFKLDSGDEPSFEKLLAAPSEGGERTEIQIVDAVGRRHVVEVEVQDDLRRDDQKIVFLYDITEVVDLRHVLEERPTFHDIVGHSAAMRATFEQMRQVAPLDLTVLIQGETGTGKELAARAIHYQSPRRSGPLIPVNCAALSESLLTSQLFGHRRGAFTGAVSDQKGMFETAAGGTIFLDEIGDMPLAIQTSLLRVLQEREITRLGESKPRQIDVRVIAATHCDLKKKVEEGSFRADLYYRIHGYRLVVPPLRERREDIPLLAFHFLRLAGARGGAPEPEISKSAVQRLVEYPWPGNVRELRSAVEWAAVRSDGIVRVEDLPEDIASGKGPGHAPGSLEEEEVRIRRAIREAGGNRSEAARRLGISRATLYRRLTDLRLGSEIG